MEPTLAVTLALRPRTPIPDRYDPAVSRDDFERAHAASPDDVAGVTALAERHGLHVDAVDAVQRRVVVSGPRAAVAAAFAPEGPAPRAAGSTAVDAVLGLDDAPAAAPLSVVSPNAADQRSLTPLEVARAYHFPEGDGAGAHVAVISLGGRFDAKTQNAFTGALGVPRSPWTVVDVDGGATDPHDPGASGENALDTEIIGALAPAAAKTLYIAPNSDRGFVDAIEAALHDGRHNDVISISWGSPEEVYAPAARAALDVALREARAMGVSVFAAAGDGGSSDGARDGVARVDFPASDPAVVACGGTRLTLDARGGIASETVWNDRNGAATGGGVSEIFPRPPAQAGVTVPPAPSGFAGRGVPDVAGDADPITGFEVLLPPVERGKPPHPAVIGGTSAVAPLYAALGARIEGRLGHPLGDAPAAIYAAPDAAFRDVVHGNNGAYRARPGWDATTGRGSIVGDAFLASVATGGHPPRREGSSG